MKKVLIVISLLMVILMATVTECDGASEESSSQYWDGSTYHYVKAGAGGNDPYRSTITGYDGSGTHIKIKSAMEGYPVTVIGESSFTSGIISVVIPETVESIGKEAFKGCSELSDVYFLGSLPEIGTDAFAQDVTFHYINGSEGWDTYAEHRTEEWTTVLSEGIEYYVFAGEATVHRYISGSVVNIPDSIESEGAEYPVTSVGAYSFYDITEGAISVVLGSNVKIIDERAFYKCKALTMINLESIVYINDEAFRECSNLWNNGELVFSGSVRYLGFESFRMCHSIVYAKVPGSVEFFGEGVLRASNSLERVDLEVRELPQWSLDNCTKLNNVILRGTETIGSNAFMNDTALESITLPDTVRLIGDQAFAGCRSLSSVSLGGTEMIGNGAFKGCTSLTTITIPSSVIRIGNGTFSMCNLSKVSFEGDRPEMGSNVFAGSKEIVIEYTSEHAGSWEGYNEHPTSIANTGSPEDNKIVYIILAAAAIIVALAFIIRTRRTE